MAGPRITQKSKISRSTPARPSAEAEPRNPPLFGHEEARTEFVRRVRTGRWEGSYLVVGREGIGRGRFCRAAASFLLCENREKRLREGALDGCRGCPACREGETHPDRLWIAPPEGKKLIPVAAVRQGQGGEKDYPRTVDRFLQLASYGGRARIVGIDPAGALVEAAANALLKILEEPPPETAFFLVAGSDREVLPTIRSRCQIIRLSPADPGELAAWLVRQGVEKERAPFLASFSGGAAGRALALSRPEAFAELVEAASLCAAPSPPVAFAEKLRAWADAGAGKTKEGARARLRLAIELLLFAWESPEVLAGVPGLSPIAARPPRDLRERKARQKAALDALRDLDANVFLPLVTTPFALRLAGQP